MSKIKKYYKLHTNCIPVKGKKRNIICDVYRGNFRFIPNALYYILTKYKEHTVESIKFDFNHEHDIIIDEYFDFLEQNEFIFYCDKKELKLFPKLNSDFETPNTISNCILDISKESRHDLPKIYRELIKLNCNHIQLRFFENNDLIDINKKLKQTEKFNFSAIHLIIPYKEKINKEWIWRIYKSLPISQIDFYGVPTDIIKNLKKESIVYPFYFYSKKIIPTLNCGVINSNNFNINIDSFIESKKHNSCLNKKLGIDSDGNIKNCPSFSSNYGNVKHTKLIDVVNTANFQKYWNITKDQIFQCKNCEFRYICTDCRAYLENPNDIYSKPLKCGYNPSESKWENWSKNPLKRDAIEHYNLKQILEIDKF